MCVSARSNLAGLGAGSQGHCLRSEGLARDRARQGPGTPCHHHLPGGPSTSAEPGEGAGSFHWQGGQAAACPLPACAALSLPALPSPCLRCPINSHWPQVVSPLVVPGDGSPQMRPIPSFHLHCGAERRTLPTPPPCAPPLPGDVWSFLLPHRFSLCTPPGLTLPHAGSMCGFQQQQLPPRRPSLTPKKAHAMSHWGGCAPLVGVGVLHRGGLCSIGVCCAP